MNPRKACDKFSTIADGLRGISDQRSTYPSYKYPQACPLDHSGIVFKVGKPWKKNEWVNCGVPQGSVLFLDLWNLIYDSQLKIDHPS